MRDSAYPKPVVDVVATLTDICRHQKRSALVELLENAHAHFEETDYDNWNGGTTNWALRLEVPVVLFASAQPCLSDIEKELGQRLDFLDRLYPNDPLGEVTITPLTSAEMALGQRMAVSNTDVHRVWRDAYFRLFLSHVSQHKEHVSHLKTALLEMGISAFVAHEDIEPSLEWQSEISLALRSMHALAALITPNFHGSNWTDQEVGWSLGRGVPVIPVRLDADPYGFVGKIQAIRGALTDPTSLASDITQALLRSTQVHGHMRRALVEAFQNANSFAAAKRIKGVVVTVDDFTEDEKERLRNACTSNNQVCHSWGVTDAIYDAFGAPKTSASTDNETPF
jgi:hypothetical protein